MELKRYSELDWLRVILIFAVFLHHVFMPFNGDGWHVMNSESSKLLDDIMVYFEQIRLPLLFFIAGAGSFLLLTKRTYKNFYIDKFNRLFVPLIIGMMFIIPPQIYYEHTQEYQNILEAYKHHLLSFNNHHLWFIEFLVVFMLLAPLFYQFLTSTHGVKFILFLESLTSKKHGLMLLVLPLIVLRLTLKLIWPEQDKNIDNLSVSLFYLYFFFIGLTFIKSKVIWSNIRDRRFTNVKSLLLFTAIFYSYYYKPDISDLASLTIRWQMWWLVCTFISWSALLAITGYAIAFFRQTPNWLKTCNQLSYPFYILHQTVIIALGFYIIQWQASIFVKSTALLVSSLLLTCFLCFAVIRPFKPLRYLFGLKIDDPVNKQRYGFSKRAKPNL